MPPGIHNFNTIWEKALSLPFFHIKKLWSVLLQIRLYSRIWREKKKVSSGHWPIVSGQKRFQTICMLLRYTFQKKVFRHNKLRIFLNKSMFASILVAQRNCTHFECYVSIFRCVLHRILRKLQIFVLICCFILLNIATDNKTFVLEFISCWQKKKLDSSRFSIVVRLLCTHSVYSIQLSTAGGSKSLFLICFRQIKAHTLKFLLMLYFLEISRHQYKCNKQYTVECTDNEYIYENENWASTH